jgi:hypothetical protein
MQSVGKVTIKADWPDETLHLLPGGLLRFGVPAQRRKAAKAQRKDMMSSWLVLR